MFKLSGSQSLQLGLGLPQKAPGKCTLRTHDTQAYLRKLAHDWLKFPDFTYILVCSSLSKGMRFEKHFTGEFTQHVFLQSPLHKIKIKSTPLKQSSHFSVFPFHFLISFPLWNGFEAVRLTSLGENPVSLCTESRKDAWPCRVGLGRAWEMIRTKSA